MKWLKDIMLEIIVLHEFYLDRFIRSTVRTFLKHVLYDDVFMRMYGSKYWLKVAVLLFLVAY